MKNEKNLSPEERYEQAVLDLACYRLMQKELKELDESFSSSEIDEIESYSRAALPKKLAFIRKKVRLGLSRKTLFKTVARLAKVAAVILLVLNTAISLAFTVIPTFRAQLVRFLVQSNSSCADLSFEEIGEGATVPEGCEENYYPSYIPDGYSLSLVSSDKGFSIAKYENDKNKSLRIYVCGVNAVSTINVENARVEHIELFGTKAMVVHQPHGEVDIVWSVGDVYFTVTSSESYELALKVAKSMSLIRK